MLALFDVLSQPPKVPPPKMPIRHHVKLPEIEISMTTATINLGFSIKNPTIESEVSWSSLLSFLHFRRTEFSTDAAVNPDRVPASSPEKLQAQTKICIFWNPAKLQAEQGFPD